MSIASVTDYSTIFNITPTVAEQAVIQSNLDYATALLNKYCDRVLESATYSEWIKQPYTSDKQYVYTDQYPITKVLVAGVPEVCAKIQNSNDSATIASCSYDSNVFSLFWIDDTGNDNTIEILASSNKVFSALKTSIETNSGWYCNVDTNFTTAPVAFIKSFDIAQVKDNEYDLEIASITNNKLVGKVEIVDENCLKFNEAIDNVFVKYIGGFTSATMPKDLIWVTCQVASDLASFATGGIIDSNSGISNNMIVSESIADYSYQKDKDAFNRDTIISKYETILSRYAKRTFIQ